MKLFRVQQKSNKHLCFSQLINSFRETENVTLFLDVENGSAKVQLVFIINMNTVVSRFKVGIEVIIRVHLRNRISIESCYHANSTLIAMYLIVFEYQSIQQ